MLGRWQANLRLRGLVPKNSHSAIAPAVDLFVAWNRLGLDLDACQILHEPFDHRRKIVVQPLFQHRL